MPSQPLSVVKLAPRQGLGPAPETPPPTPPVVARGLSVPTEQLDRAIDNLSRSAPHAAAPPRAPCPVRRPIEPPRGYGFAQPVPCAVPLGPAYPVSCMQTMPDIRPAAPDKSPSLPSRRLPLPPRPVGPPPGASLDGHLDAQAASPSMASCWAGSDHSGGYQWHAPSSVQTCPVSSVVPAWASSSFSRPVSGSASPLESIKSLGLEIMPAPAQENDENIPPTTNLDTSLGHSYCSNSFSSAGSPLSSSLSSPRSPSKWRESTARSCRPSGGLVFNPASATVEDVQCVQGHARVSRFSVFLGRDGRQTLTPLVEESRGGAACSTNLQSPDPVPDPTPRQHGNLPVQDAFCDSAGGCSPRVGSMQQPHACPREGSLPLPETQAALQPWAMPWAGFSEQARTSPVSSSPTGGVSPASTAEAAGAGRVDANLQNTNTGELFTRFLCADTAASACATLEALLDRCVHMGDRCAGDGRSLGGPMPHEMIRQLPGLPWRAESVWKLLDARLHRKEYAAAPLRQTRAVVCGAGPCGLRAATELALLGARVTIVEKRGVDEAFSRINRLHLWEWCKQDLLEWGAKLFDPPGGTFGGDNDFCHIGIGELQLLLLKNALLLGASLRCGTEARGVENRALACQDGTRLPCEVLLLADGANSPLARAVGLPKKAIGLRGKGSAIGVVANFVHTRDPSEMALRQFSWARQFNAPLFADVAKATKLDLENIVYYRGPTSHYVIMTPTKRSLLAAGVLLESNPRSGSLTGSANVNIQQLSEIVQRVAQFFGLPTTLCPTQAVMIFDFSGVKRLETAATLVDGVFVSAVGDALLEPFWPEGLGIMRGFLSAMDAASAAATAVTRGHEEAIAEMTNTFNVLKSVAAQSASRCLKKDLRQYRLSPDSRYVFGQA
eukprot:TRINITY_DN51105_c0_g1_i1.p1 TRINITY_DN51105_c0_g1~~TRINITY_DN51105_c0_g1_i1.p1  ORF type:complete len:895 (-),score=145.48 TRINITY_DN51105_c0_g1_i1:69-2753(-)